MDEEANNKIEREIIVSIFPEKLVLDGMHYLTARLNEVVSLIYSMDKIFSENKNGQTEGNFELSSFSYPTWIRTKTSRIRICGTTVILSGIKNANVRF